MADKTLGIQVTGDIDDITDKLSSLVDSITNIPDRIIELTTKVDDSSLQVLETELTNLDNENVTPNVSIDDQTSADITKITEGLTELDGESAYPTVGLIDNATESETSIKTGLEEIDNENVSAIATIDGDALEQIEDIKLGLDEIDASDVTANISLDGADDAIDSTEAFSESSDKASGATDSLTGSIAGIVGSLGLYKLGMDGLNYDKYIEQAIVYGHTTDSMKGSIRDLVNSLSGASTPANDVAESFAYLSRATGNVNDAMMELPGVMHYVKTSGADLENSVYILSNLFDQYGINAEDSADETAYLADMWTQTKLSGDQFLQLINRLSTDMQTLGFSLDDTAAIVAAFDKSGISADQAMRAMRSGFAGFIKDFRDGSPALESMEKAIKSLGISTRDSAGNLRPAKDVLSEVLVKLAQMPDGTQKTAAAMDIFGSSTGRIIGKLKVNYQDLENQAKTSSKGESDAIRAVGKSHQDAAAVINNEQQKLTSGWGETASQIATWISIIIGSVILFASIIPPFLASIGKAWDFVFPPEAGQSGAYDRMTSFNKKYEQFIKKMALNLIEKIKSAGKDILNSIKSWFGWENTAGEAGRNAADAAAKGFEDGTPRLTGTIDEIGKSTENSLKGIAELLDKEGNVVANVAYHIVDDIGTSFEEGSKDASKTIDKSKLFDSINSFFNKLTQIDTSKITSKFKSFFSEIKRIFNDEGGAVDLSNLSNKIGNGLISVINTVKKWSSEFKNEFKFADVMAEADAAGKGYTQLVTAFRQDLETNLKDIELGRWEGKVVGDLKTGGTNIAKAMDELYAKITPRWRMEDLMAKALGEGRGFSTVTDDISIEFRIAAKALGYDLSSMASDIELYFKQSVPKAFTNIENELYANSAKIKKGTTSIRNEIEVFKQIMKGEGGSIDFSGLANKIGEEITKVVLSIKSAAAEFDAAWQAGLKDEMANKALDEFAKQTNNRFSQFRTSLRQDFDLAIEEFESSGKRLNKSFTEAMQSNIKNTSQTDFGKALKSNFDNTVSILKDEEGRIGNGFSSLTNTIENGMLKVTSALSRQIVPRVTMPEIALPSTSLSMPDFKFPEIEGLGDKLSNSILSSVLPKLKGVLPRISGEIAGWGPGIALSWGLAMHDLGAWLKESSLNSNPFTMLFADMPGPVSDFAKKITSVDWWLRLLEGDKAAGTIEESLNKTISEPFNNWIAGIPGWMASIPSQLSQSIGTPLNNALDQLFTGIFPSTINADGFLNYLSYQLPTDMSNALSAIPGQISGSVTGFLTYLATIPTQIIGSFTNIDWNSIGYSVGSGIGQLAIYFLQGIYEILKALFSLPGQISSIGIQAYNSVISLGQWIYNGLIALPGNISKGLTEIWNQFMGFLNNLKSTPAKAGQYVTDSGNSMKDALSSIPGKILKGLQDIWNQFLSFIKWLQGLPGSVSNWITKTFNDTVNYLKGIPGAVLKELQNIWKQFTDFIGWIQSLPKQLYDAIVAAWDGFVKGITDKMPQITALLDQIRGLFPHSPPKWGPLIDIYDWGGNMADAIQSGLNSSMPGVVSNFANKLETLKNIGSDLTVPLSANIMSNFALPQTVLNNITTNPSTSEGTTITFAEGSIRIELPNINSNTTPEEAKEIGSKAGEGFMNKVTSGFIDQVKNKYG